MPVELKMSVEKCGWKSVENKREGSVALLNFYDVTSGLLLFSYSATLRDLPFVKSYCNVVELIDRDNKRVLDPAGDLDFTNKGCCNG